MQITLLPHEEVYGRKLCADSYNLDATIKRSDAPRATVPEENGLSSLIFSMVMNKQFEVL